MRGPRGVSTAAIGMAYAAVLVASMACAAAEPVLTALVSAAPTQHESASWSLVDIAKPTQTPIPPAPVIKAQVPEASPTPEPEEPPLITMVIVADDALQVSAEAAPEVTDPSGKYVVVSISEQHLYAYEDDQLLFSFAASTGMGNSTRVGSFRVLDKIPSAYGANWSIWMPNWLGIYWSGTLENGIHALPILPGGSRLWSGYLGTPISYGCVVLGVDEAMQLYEWADIGTPVEIRW